MTSIIISSAIGYLLGAASLALLALYATRPRSHRYTRKGGTK